MSFNEADEIANDYDFFDDIVRKLDAEVIFDRYDQFKAIKPVSSEIIEKVCLIRDTLGFYSQMFCNKIADVYGDAFIHGRRALNQTADAHDQSPTLRTASASEQAIRPGTWRYPKILRA
jgi:hypothetical protein